MAQLLIRNLPDPVKEQLRQRARDHGRSMEAEARKILVDYILPSTNDPVLIWLADAEQLRQQIPGPEFTLPSREAPRDVALL